MGLEKKTPSDKGGSKGFRISAVCAFSHQEILNKAIANLAVMAHFIVYAFGEVSCLLQ